MGKEKILLVLQHRGTIIGGTAVVSFAAGFGVANLVLKRSIEAKYADIADLEISKAQRYYADLNDQLKAEMAEEDFYADVDGDIASGKARVLKEATVEPYGDENEDQPEMPPAPSGVEREKYRDRVRAEQYTKYHDDPIVEEKVDVVEEKVEVVEEVTEDTPHNIFDDPDTEFFDNEVELMKKENGIPYVVSRQEHEFNDLGYTEATLTYFAGDDVLIDERDMPIENVEETVGEDSLTKFGFGSGDKYLVYVRNDRLQVDYEIVYNDNHYVEHVLGFEHSDYKTKVGKFRGVDE